LFKKASSNFYIDAPLGKVHKKEGHSEVSHGDIAMLIRFAEDNKIFLDILANRFKSNKK